jgi:phosphatidylserine/phosphatidylglycerophosphate/cardiolipin synthase-like enzyme
MPHAKLLLCDGVVGYLGSANVSLHGLREQFEVGVRLEAQAIAVLEQALDVLVRRGTYTIWSPEEDKAPIP